MSTRDVLPVLGRADVHPRAHDVLGPGAGLRERVEDDREAEARLLVSTRGRRRAVGRDRRRTRHMHVPAHDERAAVTADRLVGRTGGDLTAVHGQLVSRRVEALRQVESWGARQVAVGVLRDGEVVATHGPRDVDFRWASVTKPAVALATLVAAEEGTIDLDESAGPEGSTVRHLLAHASGLPFEGATPIAKPGRRRIYSNTGFDRLADAVAHAAEMPFEEYLRAAVLHPLGMSAQLRGSPAAGIHGTLDDLLALAREFQSPTLVAPETLAEATSVQFPGLGGVLPDVGRFDPNDWGLGVELRDAKTPHWTGMQNSARTFGHFGGSGAFLWVDPEARIACACLTDREFDKWALDAWPRLSDAVLEEA
jgi:CubicO group peptidase (beta-lactamase class C family)